tara:strand:- start:12 stop:149 length:138 start_codon:yes stop_codon:yes gene_type:complete
MNTFLAPFRAQQPAEAPTATLSDAALKQTHTPAEKPIIVLPEPPV